MQEMNKRLIANYSLVVTFHVDIVSLQVISRNPNQIRVYSIDYGLAHRVRLIYAVSHGRNLGLVVLIWYARTRSSRKEAIEAKE